MDNSFWHCIVRHPYIHNGRIQSVIPIIYIPILVSDTLLHIARCRFTAANQTMLMFGCIRPQEDKQRNIFPSSWLLRITTVCPTDHGDVLWGRQTQGFISAGPLRISRRFSVSHRKFGSCTVYIYISGLIFAGDCWVQIL